MTKRYRILLCTLACSVLFCAAASAQDFWQNASIQNNVSRNVNVMATGPGGLMFAGTNGQGLFRTLDGGGSWTRIDPQSLGNYFYSIAYHNDTLWVGGFDGSIYRSSDSGDTWTIDAIDAHGLVSSIIFPSTGGVLAAVTDTSGGVFYLSRPGAAWVRLHKNPYHFTAITQLLSDGTGGLYAGTYGAGLFHMAKNDSVWIPMGLSGFRVNQFAMMPGNIFLAATDFGVFYSDTADVDPDTYAPRVVSIPQWIHRSEFSTGADTLLRNAYVPSLVVANSGHAIVGTFHRGLFHTSDYGETWDAVNTGYQKINDVRCLVINQAGFVYFGADSGKVFKTASPEPFGGGEVAAPAVAALRPISLEPSYPNPFNPTTTIPFTLRSAGYASLRIYNSIGQQVAVLVDGMMSAGRHAVRWDAGSSPDGVYFYRLQSASAMESGKLVLLK